MSKVETGVMVMKNHKAWGVIYADGHSTSYGWVDPESAPIHDPRFCTAPTYVTYKNGPYTSELRSAKVVQVTRTTTVVIHGDAA